MFIMMKSTLFSALLVGLGLAIPLSIFDQKNEASGILVYHKIYPGVPGHLEETVSFSGGESLQRVKRKKQVHELSNGYRITHPAKDERMYLDQRNGRIVRQQYDKKKKDYILWSYDAPAYNWQLHDEYRTIKGYQCQKATVVYHEPGWGVATAWFTLEIPLSVGPERTYGLPGLIVEMGFENNWDAKYVLQEVRYEPVGDLEPTEGILISDSQNSSKKRSRKKALRGILSNEGN